MDVEFDSVRVERDGRLVLDIPSLRLRGSRTTAILGPNGSGKTTLLRLIAGLERPSTGGTTFGGSPSRPHIAYVFQEQVFLRRSVQENLALGLQLRGVEAGARRTRIAEAAALLGIEHLLDRRADRLSGGEGRRVSLARALCLRAPLVLLDEPLEGLDERSYLRLLDELPGVLGAFDATTLLVTHTRHEALRLADDLVVLIDGRVNAAGDKRQVAASPRRRDVADVLGYVALTAGGRHVAVPPGALRPGPGPLAFSLVVEQVLDLVEGHEIVGRIDDVRVHVTVPATPPLPQPGACVTVSTERWVELEGG